MPKRNKNCLLPVRGAFINGLFVTRINQATSSEATILNLIGRTTAASLYKEQTYEGRDNVP